MADLKIVLARCREGIVARDECIAQLEEENDRLNALSKALKAQKDPDDKPVPWDKAKLELRIAQLEEALRGALYIIKELQFAGPKDWHVIEELHTKAQTALASLREPRDAEAPEKEG